MLDWQPNGNGGTCRIKKGMQQEVCPAHLHRKYSVDGSKRQVLQCLRCGRFLGVRMSKKRMCTGFNKNKIGLEVSPGFSIDSGESTQQPTVVKR